MKQFSFKVIKEDKDTCARLGELVTPHGVIHTPVFMPVGTQATVKTMTGQDLEILGVEIILCNTFHLYLRPGIELIEKAGGLHSFMNWHHPILTDSGGYQIFSLSQLREVKEEGVCFYSHLDGGEHLLTPKKVIQLQIQLGSDIIMPLDECIGAQASTEETEAALRRTLNWAGESVEYFKTFAQDKQVLFGIIQGGKSIYLRKRALEEMKKLNFFGYAIGGLSVGEGKEIMYSILKFLSGELPADTPRYLMGVGTPEDILAGVENGVDMFDCVYPTRVARTGTLITWKGKINLKNKEYAYNFSPPDPNCSCYCCRHHSLAYLRHLLLADEILAPRLLTYHNLFFMLEFMAEIKRAIKKGNFLEFKNKFLSNKL